MNGESGQQITPLDVAMWELVPPKSESGEWEMIVKAIRPIEEAQEVGPRCCTKHERVLSTGHPTSLLLLPVCICLSRLALRCLLAWMEKGVSPA